MPRPKLPNVTNIDEIFEQAEQEQTSTENEPKKRGRKPGSTNKKPALTKDALESLITMSNFGAVMCGQQEYALTPPEIEKLTDAWYDVLCLYPKVAGMILAGNTWLVWGSAISVTYMVVSKRLEYYNEKQHVVKPQNPPGATPNNNRDERNGENHPGETDNVYAAVSTSFGLEA